MFMKKLFAFVLIISCLALCSCTTDTSGESYELTSEKWYGKLKGGAEVSLEFSENAANLKLKSGNDEIAIKGYYAIDDNSFMIFNDEFKQSYSFGYTVNGNKLNLKYCQNEIEIEKVK